MKPALPFDPAHAAAHLRAADPVLGAVIARVGPCALQLRPAASTFAALLQAIIYQQLNGKAAAAILGRVQALFSRENPLAPAALLATSDATLRAAGLSRGKIAALRDLAARSLDGAVPSLRAAARLADDELVTRLTAVRGIGPWTVHMLLIFRLGRPDVMPTGDFAIRQAFQRLYRKRREPSPETILRHARRWQPYRSVASWYLWRSLELD